MALTRPTIYNLNTNIEVFNDSITVLNAAATSPTTDVGFVFNRAHGLVPNAATYWSESLQSFEFVLTNSNGAPNSNIAIQSYANVSVGNLLLVQGSILGVVGNLQIGNLTANSGVYGNTASITGNITGGNVLAAGFFYANGSPFVSSSYGNVQMLANLAAAGNPITIGSNLTVGGNVVSNVAIIGNNVNLYSTGGQVLNITGNTYGDGGANTGANALVYINQTNSWSGAQPWSLYVNGYTSLGGFRINASDGIRALYRYGGGTIGFATADASNLTFSTSASATQFVVAQGSSNAVNYVQAVGSATTFPPIVSAQGSDTNISLQLQGKGSGNVFVNSPMTIASNLNVSGNIVSTGTSYLIGNVGINTPPSNYILDILDTSANGIGMRVIGGNTGGPLASFTRYGTSSTVQIAASNSDAAVTFQHGTSNYMSIGTDGSYFRLANYSSIGSGSDLFLVNQSNGNVVVTSTTSSTSTNTGALTVAGGAGIGGNVYVGGNLVVTGNITTINYETVLYTETANVLTANTLTVSGNVVFGTNASVGASVQNTILLNGVLQPYTAYDLVGDTYANVVLSLPSQWGIVDDVSSSYVRYVMSRDGNQNFNLGQSGTGFNANVNIYAGVNANNGVNLYTGSSSQYRTTIDTAGNLNVAGNAIVNGGILTLANVVGSNTAAVIATTGTTGNTALVLQPQGNIDLSTSVVNLSNGTGVTAITKITAGTGYTSLPTLAITAPTTAGGVQAVANVTYMTIQNVASIGSGGTGYTVGDVLTLSGGTVATSAVTLTVSTVSSGVITGVTISSYGSYSVLPSQPAPVTGGTGNSATFNIGWGVGAFTITNAGSGYVEQPTVTFSGGGSSGASAYATVGNIPKIQTLGNSLSFSTPFGEMLRLVDGTSKTYTTISSSGGGTQFAQGGSASNPSWGFIGQGTGNFYFSTGNSAGTVQFIVSHTASAVNYVQATGASTGGSPTISAQGSDSYIALSLQSKSAPLILSTRPTGTSFAVIDAGGTSTNYLTVTGPRVSGTAPILGASGSDANVAIVIQPKNYANIDLNSNSVVLSNGIGSITAITQTATGNLYVSAPTVTISAPQTQLTYGQNNAIQATANANIGVVFVANIVSAGTYYTPGQILTMVGNASTFANATFTVTSVGNSAGGTGNVTGLTLTTSGSYAIANANPVTFTSTSGSGLQVNVYYGVNQPTITNAGSGYVEQPTITFTGGGGAGAAAYATVGSPTSINSTGANLSIVLPQGEVIKVVTSPVILGVTSGNLTNANLGIGQYANTALTATALTGNAIAAGGVGIVGNVYGTSRIGFTWVSNSSSAAYTVFNPATNSIDTYFA